MRVGGGVMGPLVCVSVGGRSVRSEGVCGGVRVLVGPSAEVSTPFVYEMRYPFKDAGCPLSVIARRHKSVGNRK